jgi:endonuclease-3
MSLRRSSRTVQKDGMKSKYFLKSESASNVPLMIPDIKPDDRDEQHVSNILGDETPVRFKQEEEGLKIPKDSLPNKRRRVIPKIEIKQEISDLIPKLEPQEVDELNNIDPVIPPDALNTKLGPKNWYQIYQHVKAMRAKIIAPVDTMGCAEIPNTLNQEIEDFPEEVYRFQLLVSLILSSQTKDEVNYKAMANMKQHFQSMGHHYGITVDAMKEVDEKKLDQLIFSVGFHSRKASYLKRVALILSENYNNDIPNTLDGLVALPGVGPKMAYLTLQKAWNMNVGIGVDTHVDRLSKMWKWVDAKKCKDADKTRAELEKWLPMEYWNEINPLLVGFGQVICLPRGRRCDLCTLSQTRLCPNVDRALLKKAEKFTPEELKARNKTIRGDITLLQDIEDLAS